MLLENLERIEKQQFPFRFGWLCLVNCNLTWPHDCYLLVRGSIFPSTSRLLAMFWDSGGPSSREGDVCLLLKVTPLNWGRAEPSSVAPCFKSYNPAFSFRYTIGISSNSDNDPYQFRNLDFWKCLFTACLFKVWLATTSYRYADSVVLRRRKKGPCTLRIVLNRSWRRGWQCRTKYAAAWLTPVGRKACHVVEQRCSRRSLRWLMSNNSTWSWPIQSARLNHGGINFHCHISC